MTEDKFYQQQFGSWKADGQEPTHLADQGKLKPVLYEQTHSEHWKAQELRKQQILPQKAEA